VKLNIDVADFDAAKFIENLAKLLGIDPSRIKIVDVRAGSVILKLQILGSETTNEDIEEIDGDTAKKIVEENQDTLLPPEECDADDATCDKDAEARVQSVEVIDQLQQAETANALQLNSEVVSTLASAVNNGSFESAMGGAQLQELKVKPATTAEEETDDGFVFVTKGVINTANEEEALQSIAVAGQRMLVELHSDHHAKVRRALSVLREDKPVRRLSCSITRDLELLNEPEDDFDPLLI
jgi:hypothetical protein